MKEETPDIIAEINQQMNEIKSKLKYLIFEPTTVIHSNKNKQFMERIKNTTKYLSNNRKIIYDITFLKLYNFDYRIPGGCLAINDWLVKIDRYAHIDQPDSFLKILEEPAPKIKGRCFYLDDVLYLENVSLSQLDRIRDLLLTQRNDGTMWFEVLKIVDLSGNETLFLPSYKAIINHGIQQAEEKRRSKNIS